MAVPGNLWLAALLCSFSGFFISRSHVQAMTTEATSSSEENDFVPDDQDDWIQKFPQSALSLFGLATFIILSMVIAAMAEKCYERLSIREDSSDMSEGTKDILRARLLGMVFGKKTDEFSELKGEAREKALAKKYVQKWHYKMIMQKNKRKKEQVEEKRRGSVFSKLTGNLKKRFSIFGNTKGNVIAEESEENNEAPPSPEKQPAKPSQPPPPKQPLPKQPPGAKKIPMAPKTKSQNGVPKGPMVPTPNKVTPRVNNPAPGSPAKVCRSPTKSEFVTVDLKHALEAVEKEENAEITITSPSKESIFNAAKQPTVDKLNMDMNKSFEDDEFAIDMTPLPSSRTPASSMATVTKGRSVTKLSKGDTESSITSNKYKRAETPKVKAEKQKTVRPLTAGRSRQIAPGGAQVDAKRKADGGTSKR